MVINDLKNELTQQLGKRDTQLLITQVLDLSLTDYILCNNIEISEKTVQKIYDMSRRIKSGEPLQYVVGTTEFMSLKFNVKPGVLIPRPDTETLVEFAISVIKNDKLNILDIGSGSGCIAISIAHYCKNATVTSIDISEAALAVAKNNAELNNADVTFKTCDILTSIPDGKFDVIVSNPPYIPTKVINTLDVNVKDYEPITALDGGTDGMDFYRRIIDIAPQLLCPNGVLAFEVGHDQSENVCQLMKINFTEVKTIKDLCGIERVVHGCLQQTKD